MPRPVAQQVVVITGAGSGTGREKALTFASRGAALVLAARSRRALDSLEAEVKHLGGRSIAVPTDVSEKRQVRSVSSNDAHLLVAGIVPRTKSRTVARRLVYADMVDGWSIRTLSADHGVYNPFSYHRGSVWPVEQGTAALGLTRYGCWDELHTLAEALFAAAAAFAEHRLPETITGLPRGAGHPFPSFYPKSCAPHGPVGQRRRRDNPGAAHPASSCRCPHRARRRAPAAVADRAHPHRSAGRRHDRDAPSRAPQNGITSVRITDAIGPLTVVRHPPGHAAAGAGTRAAALTHRLVHRGTRRASRQGGTP